LEERERKEREEKEGGHRRTVAVSSMETAGTS